MRPWLRRSLALVSATLLSPLLAVHAADAESSTWADGAGDMWKVDEDDGDEWRPAPGHRNGDVIKVKVAHRSRAVLIRQSFVELGRSGRRHVLVGRIRTDSGLTRTFDITANRKDWDGEMIFAKRNGRRDRCGATHTLDYFADSATIRVPRRCLNGPEWVQVKLANAHFGREIWADNAQGPGQAFFRTWSDEVPRG